MLIYSHRGESKYAPENTMSSFFLSYLLNSDGIECDVRRTKDGQFVIIHDKTIDRTSDGKGKVCDYTISQLKEYNFGNSRYKDEKIMTLDEFLAFFSNKGLNIYLEIKEKGYEDEIWKILSKYNLSNIMIISFKYEILNNFRKISKILKFGWLVYDINKSIISDALKIKIDILICNCISLTKKDIKLIKENNLKIGAWGIKSIAELKRLNKLGLDSIVYDSYIDAKKVLKNE